MLRNYKIMLPIFLLAGIFAAFQFKSQPDPEKDRELIQILKYILVQGHYQPVEMDDTFSANIFDDFMETLDPTKHYFLQSDIDEFAQYKLQIDDMLRMNDLSFFYLVYDRYRQRIEESKAIYKEILKEGFDIKTPQTYSVDYEKAAFPVTNEALIDTWEKQLQLRFINALYDKQQLEADKQKNDSTYSPLSFEELQKDALEQTEENMERLYERIDELTQDDIYSYFINSITAQFGPHTTYLSPKIKKRFDISMSGKLEGIGARLMKEGQYTKVTELISGGPAWRAGELEVGDIILSVAQADGEPLDIVGMRLDDAIEYIKGKKGTEVRLTLKRVNGTIKTISIIRDVVELEETFVKSAIVELEGKKYGIVHLPKFYIDFDEKNYRNSATDMEKELTYLKEEGVAGILLDLRNNGGGSLKTAIEIAGMFIDEGPVVQVKYKGETPDVRYDKEENAVWDGPLVVLVNEFSASASEIFSAAMQDYQRAVIIGNKHTFGKGTVQNIYPLNQYTRYKDDLGFLKMTIQKFYRINGGSTQLRGVTPDVIVPTTYSYLDVGERDLEKPMPWDSITPAKYQLWNDYTNFETVIQESKERVQQNATFVLIDENAQWLKSAQEDNTVYLNYDAFVKDITAKDAKAKTYEAIENYTNNLVFTSPAFEFTHLEQDTIFAQKRAEWHKNLSKDIYVDEGLEVLADLKLKGNTLITKY